MASTWKTQNCYDTEYPADSVEWCPHDPHKNLFVLGSYLLLDKEPESNSPQERIGSITLMKTEKNQLTLEQRINCQGVLDMKWCPKTCDGILLGAVTAAGEVNIYQLNEGSLKALASNCLKTEETSDYLTLALNWWDATELCVTDSKGNAAILKLNGTKLEIVEKWKAHDLEAWTVAFGSESPHLIYTGGDDAKLKLWDRRISLKMAQMTNRHHNSGVTIIQTDSGNEDIIVVGSFDETLGFFDTRRWRIPVSLVQCSGGLWRIKRRNGFLLTANIYGGFQITEMARNLIVADFKEHDSLAYGADWSHLPEETVSEMFGGSSISSLIGTCSFYDRKMIVSTWAPHDS